MTDLEDRFLKKNVPGKYSQWEEYNESSRKSEEGEDEKVFDHVQHWDNESIAKPLQQSTQVSAVTELPNTHSTGAKGVINDYKLHKKIEAYNHQIEKEEKKNILSRVLNGAYLKPGEISISASSQLSSKQRPQYDSESDDDFLTEYREKRLRQLKQAHALPSFGHFSELETPFEYADVIDNTDSRVSVIIHIYEPSIDECNLMNEHLDKLARDDLRAGTRFCRIRAFTLKDNFDTIGLPVLVLYRNSKLIKNWTRVVDFFPPEKRRKFTIFDVKELLGPEVENGFLVVNKSQSTNKSPGSTKIFSSRIDCSNDEYDSEDAELDALCADFVPSLHE